MINCPACSAENSAASKFCSECGSLLRLEMEPTVRFSASGGLEPLHDDDSRTSASDSSRQGRFLPGTRLVGRYRIVSLLGRGGMGEVYRADDLKLGQPVALKFLPRDLADDQQRHDYLHNEVRLSRQISHPNVCRVYDVAEADGQHFLSMEFVDGEDLKGLLRRIGRLPKDKGLEIARQLCAGLAAAHERGVLHRDLKPANVMIDGRGQVRITDFGLAQLAGDRDAGGTIPGTPVYMAPEQLLRGQTSIRSDLYSLGLILYEMFTGKPAHKAGSLAELRDWHSESSSSTRVPSELVDDMDPAVERAILWCLQKQPQDRPQSVAAVAVALPGGDPLAAALAAGETPSPQMVAAAGDAGGLTPGIATACLAGAVLALVIACLLAQRAYLVNRAPLERAPAVLEEKAQEILRHLGYDQPPAHSAIGFYDDPRDRKLIEDAELPEDVEDRWNLLKTGPWPGMRFWYRQSPQPMFVNDFWTGWGRLARTRISRYQPPWETPGMAGVLLDPRGNLRGFRAVPPATTVRSTSDEVEKPKWSEWFPEAYLGFALDELSEADWRRTPPDAYDAFQAWEGTWPGRAEPLYVQAAAYRGRPVHFEVVRPSEAQPDAPPPEAVPALLDFGRDFLLAFTIVMFVGAVILTWRNLRLGRGDRRGAWRLAVYVFSVGMIVWVLHGSHVGGVYDYPLMVVGLAQALFTSAQFWLYYIALEPWVRRIWPEILISWTRLLDGRLRDPRIGRDLLGGALVGAIVTILDEINVVAPTWFGLSSGLRESPPLSLLGPAVLVGEVLNQQISAISFSLFVLLLLLLFRILLRSQRLAGCGAVVVMVVFLTLMGAGQPYLAWLVVGLNSAMFVWLLVRFGLLAAVAASVVFNLLQLPITTDTSAFYFGNGLFGIAVVAAIALYGFYKSLGGRPVFRDGLSEGN